MEKVFEVTFKGDTMNPGEKKIMSENEVRASKVFGDTFGDMLFRLEVGEGLYQHETMTEYKRIR